MIKAHSTTKLKGEDRAKAFLKVMKGFRNANVTIGIHDTAGTYEGAGSPDVVEVALWQEFGTEKIPSRSWMRSTMDENAGKINSWREEMINNIVNKGWAPKKALEAIGFRIQVLLQNKIKSNVPPPYGSGKGGKTVFEIQNAQDQKKKRGFPIRTLVETQLMLRSVGFKVNLS